MVRIVILIFIAQTVYAQTPYEKGTAEYEIYGIYTNCKEDSCAEHIERVMQIVDNTSNPTMIVELSNWYFMSIASYYEGNESVAETIAEKCDSLIRYYERKRYGFWTKDESHYFKGMKHFDLTKVNAWNRKCIGTKNTNSNGVCLSCKEFKLPPPEPSSRFPLDNSLFENCKTFSNVDETLKKAMLTLEYESSYLPVSGGGFALITKMEQINEDASTLIGEYRWISDLKPPRSFTEYLASLIFERKGRFRIIVFIVTDQYFSSNGGQISKDEAVAWLMNGAADLPDKIGDEPFTSAHKCTALVYEYEVTQNNKHRQTKYHIAKIHLEKAKIMELLK